MLWFLASVHFLMFYIEATRREELLVWPRVPHDPSRGAALTAWSSTLLALDWY